MNQFSTSAVATRTDATHTAARLDLPNGTDCTLCATSTIGRSSRNDVVLKNEAVSRNHALIQRQGVAEFWLVDLGSSNGTLLNSRVVVQPVQLSNGDRIDVGEEELTFRCADPETEPDKSTLAGPTVRKLRVAREWLVLADIEGFTPLSQRLKPAELAAVVGNWLGDCRDLVEKYGGGIHKYLGDGWFASWSGEDADGQVADCVRELLDRQRAADPKFRFVVHRGEVMSSGSPAGNELGMLGPDVNFLFRMEKLAGALGCRAMATGGCWSRLEARLRGASIGRHMVAGFEDEYECVQILGRR